MNIAVVGFCFNHQTGRRNLQTLEILANKYKLNVHIITVDKWGNFNDTKLHELETKYLHICKLRTVFLFRTPSQYKYWMVGLYRTLLSLRPDVIYVQNEPLSLDTFVSLLAAKQCGSKFGFFSWENLYKKWFFPLNLIEAAVIKNSDFMIAGTNDVKETMLKKAADSRKIVVLPQTGIDIALFSRSTKNLCRKYNIDKKKTLLFVGRLLKMKGIEVILKAKELLDSKGKVYTYLFVGSGEISSKLKSGMRNVITIDWMPKDELTAVYNSSSVFLYPSIPTEFWEEQFGYSIVEALCCQIPVIASNVSGPRHIIHHGKDGYLVRVDDYKDLAEKIEMLMESRALRSKLGSYGRKDMVKRFSNEIIARKLYYLVKKVEGSKALL